MLNIKGAWKVEFVKKETINIFRFRALVSSTTEFESNIRSLIASANWKLISIESGNANLEEIFLKLAGVEE